MAFCIYTQVNLSELSVSVVLSYLEFLELVKKIYHRIYCGKLYYYPTTQSKSTLEHCILVESLTDLPKHTLLDGCRAYCYSHPFLFVLFLDLCFDSQDLNVKMIFPKFKNILHRYVCKVCPLFCMFFFRGRGGLQMFWL